MIRKNKHSGHLGPYLFPVVTDKTDLKKGQRNQRKTDRNQ